MKAIDLTKILKRHENKWVALTDDHEKVVGSGASLSAARIQAKKRGHEDPIFMKVPRFDRGFIPFSG